MDKDPAGIEADGHGSHDLQTRQRPGPDVLFHFFLIRIQFLGIPPVGTCKIGDGFLIPGFPWASFVIFVYFF